VPLQFTYTAYMNNVLSRLKGNFIQFTAVQYWAL